MPFQSEKQKRFMFVRHPAIAKKWAREQKKKGAPLVVGKLAEHVEIERGLASIYGKSKGTLVSNVGATPAPYDAIPDYADIWYQPDEDPRREDEEGARENRREAMGVANRGKYGFHGTADAGDSPMLRYETDDFPQNAPRRNPSPNERRAAIVQPNKYPQPTGTGPIKHVVQRDKMQGKAEQVGRGGFGDSNEARTPHAANAPDDSGTPKLSNVPKTASLKPAVRNEKKTRYVVSANAKPTAQRMGD